MATIKSPALFFVTSPRTPFKMRPEIDLLVREFPGKRWTANVRLQAEFMQKLARLPEFAGAYNQNNPALSARDRITRGPKALGFVDLENISLTPAGKVFLDGELADEALLRQLLKFQLPSPFHLANPRISKVFRIRPYLEILRLVCTLGHLAFDELCLFGMQLTDWHDFGKTVAAIERFRAAKNENRGRYKQFAKAQRELVVRKLYETDISAGKIKTRESAREDLGNFIKTKANNMRDYADACLRYLHATGLVTVSNPGRTVSIIESRRREVEFLLETVPRDPVFVGDNAAYRNYLFSDDEPRLLSDDRKTLEEQALDFDAVGSLAEAGQLTLPELKQTIKSARIARRDELVSRQISELKSFADYDDVITVFEKIKSKDVYDPPLALEWNAWRTMTMLDGGNVRANLSFDDAGNPLSTAPGKHADIVCDYGSFVVSVEVTLMTGVKQYDAEGEPVARHLGDIKAKTGKPAYCLFIAPKINESTISHFYMLHKTNISHYGGKSVVIPIELDRFVNMLKQVGKRDRVPGPGKIRSFCEYSMTAADSAADEREWYMAVSRKADAWVDG